MTYDPTIFWQEKARWYLSQLNMWEVQDPHKDEEKKFLSDLIKERNRQTVLEVGCGVGKNLAYLKRYNKEAKLTGMDISAPILNTARLGLNGSGMCVNGIQLVQGDSRSIPFKNGSFDLVFTRVSLMHVPGADIKDALKELVRVGWDCIMIETIGTFEHDFTINHDYQALADELNWPLKIHSRRKLYKDFERIIMELG